jgi:hypothetical protein
MLFSDRSIWTMIRSSSEFWRIHAGFAHRVI